MTWTDKFMGLAEHIATWSKDPSTKVGCVLVDTYDNAILATGYNGFPRCIADTPERLDNREVKYKLTVHAEANAIAAAARSGRNVYNAHIYVTFPPCSQCAALLIQAGVTMVTYKPSPLTNSRWDEDRKYATELLDEAEVCTTEYK